MAEGNVVVFISFDSIENSCTVLRFPWDFQGFVTQMMNRYKSEEQRK